jgi:hypothetical protein
VQQYVAALSRGGFIEQTAEPVATQAGVKPARWRIVEMADGPPIVTWATRTARHQGTPTPTDKQQVTTSDARSNRRNDPAV